MSRAKKVGGNDNTTKVRISGGTILKLVGLVLALIFFYFVREVIVILLLSLLLAALIDPFADWFSKFKINRGFAVIIVYLVLAGAIAGLFFLTAPTFREQTLELFSQYGPYLVEVSGNNEVLIAVFSGEFYNLDYQALLNTVRSTGLDGALPEILSVASGAFGIALSTIIVLGLAFYLVAEERSLRKGMSMVLPDRARPFIEHVYPKAKAKIGQWLRGQLLVMFSVFVVTYVLLEFVLDLPFALVLAVIAGVLEIVPFLGPILSSIPGIIVALAISPVHALLTLLTYFGIQQLEGQVLTPKIMKKITGINPVFSILAVLVGFELVGAIGAVLAIPVAVVVGVMWLEWISYNKK